MNVKVRANAAQDLEPNGDDPIIDEPANVVVEPESVIDEPDELAILKDQNAQLTATNNRLLEESKKHKRTRQKIEDEKLLSEGNKDKLISNMQTRLDDYTAKEDSSTIAGALAREAQKRNCPNWDLMYNACENNVVINPENGQVEGVENFFDACQADDRLNKQFFVDPTQIKTDNVVPTIPMNLYKSDPRAYLKKIRTESPEKYNETVAKMQRDGLIG